MASRKPKRAEPVRVWMLKHPIDGLLPWTGGTLGDSRADYQRYYGHHLRAGSKLRIARVEIREVVPVRSRAKRRKP